MGRRRLFKKTEINVVKKKKKKWRRGGKAYGYEPAS